MENTLEQPHDRTQVPLPEPGTDRKEYIVSLLRDQERVEVNGVAEAFDVSAMTIRRDLAELDKEGRVQRVHGGAVARRSPFPLRAEIASVEKFRIARAVNGLIANGDTVGIEVGTTCRAVARELATRDDILAVTNSLQAAIEFQRSRSSLLVLGGVMTSEFALVNGSWGRENGTIHLDKVVIGCGGISEEGVSHFDIPETEARKELIQNSDLVILAADHTKWGRRKAILLAELDVLDILVTDAEPPPELRQALRSASVEVVIAGV
ncbi:DeoR/GlpR family DNA-binding transcription regulator [Nesterenkonia lutea]|uniref:DeoR/GlpR family transcriptional regulator of sugar metabolism n=1 Tax=Nesterenkonia lutea TaxID=272919 RepID=A0ABR9JCL3_9MICC|nr:DeoR/GlpR family DNA-binding transcription regulator [Nesterenkonia lutea]MBE1523672.1 DeoR/GlpR family transcriptional regulator of sugar metabolism [Nesterenkonia lutea]